MYQGFLPGEYHMIVVLWVVHQANTCVITVLAYLSLQQWDSIP